MSACVFRTRLRLFAAAHVRVCVQVLRPLLKLYEKKIDDGLANARDQVEQAARDLSTPITTMPSLTSTSTSSTVTRR